MKTFKLSIVCVACIQSLLILNSAHAASTKPPNSVTKKQHAQPNIVYILLDDQRYDAFGFLNPKIITPNMDKIAKAGTYFKNAFVTTSLSSPSRASILTGLYARNHGVQDNNPTDISKLHFFPELLNKNGYQTGFFGKWHFGNVDYKAKSGFAGFDRWVGLIGQGDYYPIDMYGNQAMINVDGTLVPQKGYISNELTDYAIDWLDTIDKSKPFFVYLSHKGVHADFYPAPKDKGKLANVSFPPPDTFANTPENYEGKPMWVKNQRNSWHGVDYPYNKKMDLEQFQRDYYETLIGVDDSVGRVQKWLKDNGLSENTIIMVMSDNGFLFGEHGLIDKRNAYEESMRVPLIASGPGFAKGETVDDIISNVDIAPTLLDAAGIQSPNYYDGYSFYPPTPNKKKHEFITYEYFWEYSFPHTPTTFAIRTNDYKYIQYHGVWDLEELYDMKHDRSEKHNLIYSNKPEIIELKISLRDMLYHELKNKEGKNVIPYNKKDTQGQVFRYGPGGGEKMAEFPKSWLRGDNPSDRYYGLLPDAVGKEEKVKAISANAEKTEKMVEELMKKKK